MLFKDKYIYPAILSYADDGITIEFPDLPGCLPSADSTEEAIRNAKEAMALHLITSEQDHDPIPNPTPIEKIHTKPGQTVVLIEVWMPVYRDAIENNSIKKTLTIPKWLNDAAEENHIDFSQLFQDALKRTLGISDMNPR
jgi:predicted RNase H-like HicB family nuclease